MDRPSRATLLTAVGVLCVAVGVYPRWIVLNPLLPPEQVVPAVYLTGMRAGIEGFDYAFLGAVALVAASWSVARAGIRGVVTFAVGAAVLAGSLLFLTTSSLVGFLGTFVPGPGWVLTSLGGLCLLAGGWFDRRSAVD